MIKSNTKEKLGFVLALATLITNPLTGQYILQFLDWVFQKMFTVGGWISLVATVYLIALLAYYSHQSSKVKIPKGKKKTEAYIAT